MVGLPAAHEANLRQHGHDICTKERSNYLATMYLLRPLFDPLEVEVPQLGSLLLTFLVGRVPLLK